MSDQLVATRLVVALGWQLLWTMDLGRRLLQELLSMRNYLPVRVSSKKSTLFVMEATAGGSNLTGSFWPSTGLLTLLGIWTKACIVITKLGGKVGLLDGGGSGEVLLLVRL